MQCPCDRRLDRDKVNATVKSESRTSKSSDTERTFDKFDTSKQRRLSSFGIQPILSSHLSTIDKKRLNC